MTLEPAGNGVFGQCAPAAVAERPGACLGGSRQIAAEAVAAITGALAEPEQLGLLEPAGRRMSVKAAAEERRGRGRPKGAANHSSRELRRFLGAVGADPLMGTVEWLRLSPEELAARLGCNVAEAFDRQERMRDRLMPFVYAKLAPVDDAGKAVPVMVFNMGTGEGAEAEASPPWLAALARDGVTIDHEQNQALSTDGPLHPNGADPNGGGKP